MRVFYPPWKLRTRVLFCLALSWHVPRRASRKGDDDALTTVWFGGFSRHAHKCTKCLLVRSFLSFSLHVRSRSFVMEPSSKRFCFSSPEERQRLVDDAIPKRTADSNSFWKSVFLTYCQSIGKTIDFSTVTAADLAPILESFFVDVRGKNGEPYKGNSLKAAKGAIQRLLSAKDRRINIFQDAEFDKMRNVTVPQSDHSHTARCRKTPVGGNIVERKWSKEYRKGKELIYYYEQTNLADSTNTINCSCYVTSFAAVTLPPSPNNG